MTISVNVYMNSSAKYSHLLNSLGIYSKLYDLKPTVLEVSSKF